MELRTRYHSNFIVMPEHCNFRMPQIFGGAFMAKLDLCAAAACSELLQFSDSPCDNAVTYKVLDITFHKAAQMGDQIFLEAEIVELRNNSIVVQVEAYRQPRDQKFPERIHTASAKFVFVTLQGDKYAPHRMKLSQ
jgi:acyl-CoA hydrolase